MGAGGTWRVFPELLLEVIAFCEDTFSVPSVSVIRLDEARPALIIFCGLRVGVFSFFRFLSPFLPLTTIL